MEIMLTEIESLLHKIGRKNSKDTNQYFRDFWDIFHNRPERLNPEGFQKTGENQNIDPEYVRMVSGISSDLMGPCDSPTPENKENQGDIEKSVSAKCATCDFPPNDGKRRIYCTCGQ